MNILQLIRSYIAALEAQTAASLKATAVAERALRDAAWRRYQDGKQQQQHGGGGAVGGNASIPGSGAYP